MEVLSIAYSTLLSVAAAYFIGTVAWYGYLKLSESVLRDENRSVLGLFRAIWKRDFQAVWTVVRSYFPYDVHRWGDELAFFQIFTCLGALTGGIYFGAMYGAQESLTMGIMGATIAAFVMFGFGCLATLMMEIF